MSIFLQALVHDGLSFMLVVRGARVLDGDDDGRSALTDEARVTQHGPSASLAFKPSLL